VGYFSILGRLRALSNRCGYRVAFRNIDHKIMPRNYPEQELQIACVDLLNIAPIPGLFWTAINPIPAKSRAAAGLSKAMGLKAGVPDFLFIFNGNTFFIEMKATSGSLSKNQKNIISELDECGSETLTCRSLDEFVEILKSQKIPIQINFT